jgi:hypothetical protein
MSYYECKRCKHKTKQKIEMQRHLQRKMKCLRELDSYKYSDEDLYNLSMEKIKLDKTSNKSETEFICNICDKKFSRKFNLDRHAQKCKTKELISHKENNTVIEEDKSNKNIINNITNNNTVNNIQNINNGIIINLKVESFDNDWDMSKINKMTRQSLLLSKIMYTKLLENILENDVNLNVIIEKETKTGIVYKNDVEKFIKMKLKDIVDSSMTKLNKHLKDIYDESYNDDEFHIMENILEEQKKVIENKYKEYKNSEETQQKVEEFIADIYDKKKDDAIKMFNNLLIQNDGINLIDGF